MCFGDASGWRQLRLGVDAIRIGLIKSLILRNHERCSGAMIAFKTAQKSAGTSASTRVKFEWSDAWEFRWDDVYARFGVPRNIPVEQLNVLGGSYPCSVVNQGEKCVHYAKEGITFAGNVERDDVREVRIMKKLDQDWDERIRDAGLGLGGER